MTSIESMIEAVFEHMIDGNWDNLSVEEQADYFLARCKSRSVDPLSGALVFARVDGQLKVLERQTERTETSYESIERPTTVEGKAILSVRPKSNAPQGKIVLNSSKGGNVDRRRN